MIKKITPVLIVDAIEPVVPLWTSLGFERAAEVPDGDRLGFVLFARDGAEVMYQTVASVQKDEPRSLQGQRSIGASAVYVEVENLDEMTRLIPRETDVIERRRETFYGAIEMILRDAAGNVVILAQMKP